MNDMKKLERMAMVAIWCIQENPAIRPCMVKVTEMLEGVVEDPSLRRSMKKVTHDRGAVEVAVPSNPFSFISSLG
ncbi:hypothetical protein AAC387_Pa02g1138 [Persea americana]